MDIVRARASAIGSSSRHGRLSGGRPCEARAARPWDGGAMRWIWAAVMAAAAAATPRAVLAQDAPTSRPTTTASATLQAAATVDQLLAALTDANSSPGVRQDAARRLVSRQSPEARGALRQA